MGTRCPGSTHRAIALFCYWKFTEGSEKFPIKQRHCLQDMTSFLYMQNWFCNTNDLNI